MSLSEISSGGGGGGGQTSICKIKITTVGVEGQKSAPKKSWGGGGGGANV